MHSKGDYSSLSLFSGGRDTKDVPMLWSACIDKLASHEPILRADTVNH